MLPVANSSSFLLFNSSSSGSKFITSLLIIFNFHVLLCFDFSSESKKGGSEKRQMSNPPSSKNRNLCNASLGLVQAVQASVTSSFKTSRWTDSPQSDKNEKLKNETNVSKLTFVYLQIVKKKTGESFNLFVKSFKEKDKNKKAWI